MLFGQDNSSNLAISPRLYVDHISVPSEAQNLLISKLQQIASQNGLSSMGRGSRFILTVNVSVLNREISGTVPTTYVNNLSFDFFIGDEVEKTIYSSISVQSLGIGSTDAKSFISAINKIEPNKAVFKDFISQGKSRIISFYESNCTRLLNEASVYSSAGHYDKALNMLLSIPDAVSCKGQSLSVLKKVYQERIDFECKAALLEGKALWSSNPSYEGAMQVKNLIDRISPLSVCYPEAMVFIETIRKRMIDLDTREWNYTMTVLENERQRELFMLDAIKSIGVAYGNNQPDVIVRNNFIGWW